jgi:radical SAM protein, TIGR01212 family
MKELFLRHHIPCIRTGLQSTVDLDDGLQVLAGAYAPAMGDMVDSLRYGRQIRFLLEDLGHTGRVTIRYNRRDTSRTRGYKNENMKLPATFKIVAAWQEDNSLPEGTVRVETDRQVWDIHTNTGERIQRS